MRPEKLLIRDEVELAKCRKFIQNAFNLENRLPDQVFQEGFTGFLFDDNSAFYSDIWEGLKSSALNSGQIITMAMIKHSKPAAFYKWDNYYSALQLSINTSLKDYQEIFSFDSPMGSALRYADITMCVPESLEWAVWQSYDLELCIIGFNKEKGADKIPLCPDWFPVNNNWMTIEQAIIDLMPPLFANQGDKVPPELARALRHNYSFSRPPDRLY